MNSLPDSVRQQFAAIAAGPHVITIGNFDGIHRGHQALLAHVMERARGLDARTLVITFEPHPVTVLRPEAHLKRLLSPERKVEMLTSLGIDDICIIPFTLEFAAVGARDFLDAIRVQAEPRLIVVGDGFRFGHKREGDCDLLREYAATYGFEAEILGPFKNEAGVFSSSLVRKALAEGRLRDAEAALGRRYRLVGVVEHGLARGRDLGYPTANLAVRPSLLIPANGIYAAYVRVDGGSPRPAMAYIGHSPTFDPRERTVEVNILDFHGDLYAKEIEIEFLAYIRGDQQFATADELVARMEEDERCIRAELDAAEPEQSDGVST